MIPNVLWTIYNGTSDQGAADRGIGSEDDLGVVAALRSPFQSPMNCFHQRISDLASVFSGPSLGAVVRGGSVMTILASWT